MRHDPRDPPFHIAIGIVIGMAIGVILVGVPYVVILDDERKERREDSAVCEEAIRRALAIGDKCLHDVEVCEMLAGLDEALDKLERKDVQK